MSYRCSTLDGINSLCRARGADGFAFIVQGDNPSALGATGRGLGYEGIRNALAIEFDTYYNPELLDAYENHVAVVTRGNEGGASAHHAFALGTAAAVPDLSEGAHAARVVYTPFFDAQVLQMGLLDPSPYATTFLESGHFASGGFSDWGSGIGLLYVYIDDMLRPRLVVPLNLEGTLSLTHGRAWVGFTAATGAETFQTHDLLDWRFAALRLTRPPTAAADWCGSGGACPAAAQLVVTAAARGAAPSSTTITLHFVAAVRHYRWLQLRTWLWYQLMRVHIWGACRHWEA
ncbi:concanavalin A-like lectin/glucanase domain-containing protein [Tribonema minus]|uniref:Concanavalin A-like lectin/glucanase domain-containing protein n=1 Tax=Tribonema minus TaxID=303371 RepID=A0A835ZC19_9STRA|nr:concanavalin A-like lectin/glucanase domain-containing protein [Tribonema minus]